MHAVDSKSFRVFGHALHTHAVYTYSNPKNQHWSFQTFGNFHGGTLCPWMNPGLLHTYPYTHTQMHRTRRDMTHCYEYHKKLGVVGEIAFNSCVTCQIHTSTYRCVNTTVCMYNYHKYSEYASINFSNTITWVYIYIKKGGEFRQNHPYLTACLIRVRDMTHCYEWHDSEKSRSSANLLLLDVSRVFCWVFFQFVCHVMSHVHVTWIRRNRPYLLRAAWKRWHMQIRLQSTQAWLVKSTWSPLARPPYYIHTDTQTHAHKRAKPCKQSDHRRCRHVTCERACARACIHISARTRIYTHHYKRSMKHLQNICTHWPKKVSKHSEPATQSHCNKLQHTATHCNTLFHTSWKRCPTTQSLSRRLDYTLQHTATHCNTLFDRCPTTLGWSRSLHTAIRCKKMHYTATKLLHTGRKRYLNTLSTLQHTATHYFIPPHCKTLQHIITYRPKKVPKHFWAHCNTKQHIISYQDTARHCKTLQHIIT